MKGSGLVVLLASAVLLSGCATQSDTSGSGRSPEETLEAYTSLGIQYLQAGNTVNAKLSLQRALELDDDYAPALSTLALVFQTEQEYELAEQYFRSALQADPDSARIHNNYGAFLFAQQRYSQACQQLQSATEDPFYSGRAQALENLGRCYQLTQQDDLAAQSFRRALAINGNRPLSLIGLAQHELDTGELASASRYFERFLDLVRSRRTEHTAASLWLGIQLARAEHDTSKASTYALILKNTYPESAEYRRYEESTQ
ncbi:type IV pilus biogenesis/stability protein PilW [Marinobacterium sp. AK62]|uniref:Type IV pilus biogenesis/stability protein PilW n=1 Tax=Marinobacterium alkalitolerans TaxID=1542925 RepID=A0ABS3Z7T1_9GAMM|nr:type IV pilus biogenesis/stability protein PilW [Marinobacterium alkalitolerans]MBP0047768.1 type IV pilus biogenesis/stability protein PilW [Marinobacterium alkalitolerans]